MITALLVILLVLVLFAAFGGTRGFGGPLAHVPDLFWAMLAVIIMILLLGGA